MLPNVSLLLLTYGTCRASWTNATILAVKIRTLCHAGALKTACGCFVFPATKMTMEVAEALLSYWWAFAALFALWWVLHPRRGGKNAPPMVLNSPIVNVPYIGMALEFGKSPVKMVRRCFDSYGPVFTVPVRSSEKPMLLSKIHFL
jgi:hypothetical protein